MIVILLLGDKFSKILITESGKQHFNLLNRYSEKPFNLNPTKSKKNMQSKVEQSHLKLTLHIFYLKHMY
jgi:hypothetical protein